MSDLKPGQKYPTPTPGFGDRVFYETLYRQRPESQMAQEWCLNYGVLHLEEAEKLYKIVLKRKGNVGSSITSSGSSKKKIKSPRKKKPIIHKQESEDPDLQIGGEEGIGTTKL